MPAYMISQAKVKDPEKYEAYRVAALPLLEQFGARYVARTGDVECLQGRWDEGVIAILEFPSREVARRFWQSPEYAEVAALRGEAAEMDVILIDVPS
jgi:uncharacterized protein (DUF1330 family)